MPVAKGKGGKKRRRGKNIVAEDTGLLKFEEGQAYGRILKLLGNGRANVECYIWTNINKDNKANKENKMEMTMRTCVGKIRGKLMKRMWMGMDDIVLVGLRDFQDDRVDIIHKYSYNDALKLKKLEYGIPNVKLDKYDDDTEEGFDFHEDDDEEFSKTKTKTKTNTRTEFMSYNNLGKMDIDDDSYSSEIEKELDEFGNSI